MHYTEAVYNLIGEKELVLDVGGYAQPFPRADYVIDVAPYHTRKSPKLLNNKPICEERFTKETWVHHDINDIKNPWPFKDNTFGFVIAGHILEDIRDPVYAISEMTRVGYRGYIEVPSRFMEQIIDLEVPGVCGFCHHRWHIDVIDNKIRCLFKSHNLHSNKNWHIQKKGDWPHLNKNHANVGIFWEGNVEAYEDLSLDLSTQKEFYTETIRLSEKLEDLYEVNAAVPTSIEDPFRYDKKPSVSVFGRHVSDEEFWDNI